MKARKDFDFEYEPPRAFELVRSFVSGQGAGAGDDDNHDIASDMPDI